MDTTTKLKDQIKLLDFKELGDERGNLVVVEGEQEIPFDIKRVFYIYGSDSTVRRGCHSNRRSSFVLINVAGSSKVLVDNGHEKCIIELNKPRMGLYLPPNIWKEMYDFSSDSVLLVLSDQHYDGQEYIRDYTTFLQTIKDNV